MFTTELDSTRALAFQIEDLAINCKNSKAAARVADMALEVHALCIAIKATNDALVDIEKTLADPAASAELKADAAKAKEEMLQRTRDNLAQLPTVLANATKLSQQPPPLLAMLQQLAKVADLPPELQIAVEAGLAAQSSGGNVTQALSQALDGAVPPSAEVQAAVTAALRRAAAQVASEAETAIDTALTAAEAVFAAPENVPAATETSASDTPAAPAAD